MDHGGASSCGPPLQPQFQHQLFQHSTSEHRRGIAYGTRRWSMQALCWHSALLLKSQTMTLMTPRRAFFSAASMCVRTYAFVLALGTLAQESDHDLDDPRGLLQQSEHDSMSDLIEHLVDVLPILTLCEEAWLSQISCTCHWLCAWQALQSPGEPCMLLLQLLLLTRRLRPPLSHRTPGCCTTWTWARR